MSESFVYVARLEMGEEVEVRRILERVPTDALADHNIEEFSSYVGSGFCVLHFELPAGDFQEQFEQFVNDPRMHKFHEELVQHFIEGEEIARRFRAGDDRHGVGTAAASRTEVGGPVTSADLPLASQVSTWSKT